MKKFIKKFTSLEALRAFDRVDPQITLISIEYDEWAEVWIGEFYSYKK